MIKKLILASSSPRRKELLKRAGFKFEIFQPDVNERMIRGESPRRMVSRLALEKAQAVFLRLSDRERKKHLIIAADTTVVAPGGRLILGKPRNSREAVKMLNRLSGQWHHVYTAYCLVFDGRNIRRVCMTRVKMKKMNPAEIKRYLKTGESYDKAGAYAAQGHGMILIERISGSYTNVIGLPVTELMGDLAGLGWRPKR